MSFERGDHACVIYWTREELASAVAAFLREGLSRGEQCWYCASDEALSDLPAALHALGTDPPSQRRGALSLIGKERLYLLDGTFDPERMISIFNDAIEDATANGFTGFRVAGEMSWALDGRPGTDRLVEYEALVGMLFATTGGTGLCLYHRDRMSPELLDAALMTHPLAAAGAQRMSNPFYRLKPIADLHKPQPGDVAAKLKELLRRRG